LSSSGGGNHTSFKTSGGIVGSSGSQKEPGCSNGCCSYSGNNREDDYGGKRGSQNHNVIRLVEDNGKTGSQGSIPFINVASVVEEEDGKSLFSVLFNNRRETTGGKEKIQRSDLIITINGIYTLEKNKD